jgi:lysozyme
MKTRTKAAALTLSAAALVGIAVSEEFRGMAYQDIVGVWTIGWGTTQGVRPGDKIDPTKALQRKMDDVAKFEGALKQCVKVPLSQGEYDAYISLSYNIGSGAFCRSTLVRKLNAGDYEGACQQILVWNKAGGKEVRGLTLRREREFKQCTGVQ